MASRGDGPSSRTRQDSVDYVRGDLWHLPLRIVRLGSAAILSIHVQPFLVPADRPYRPSSAPMPPRVLVEADPPEEHEVAMDMEANAREALYSALQRWENARDTLTAVDARIRREREADYQQLRTRIDDSCRRYLALIDRIDASGNGAAIASDLAEAGEDGSSIFHFRGEVRRKLSFARSMGSWLTLATQRGEGQALVATARSEADARKMIADRDSDED
jgi:hypothetical protein